MKFHSINKKELRKIVKKLNLWIKAVAVSFCLLTGLCPIPVSAAEEKTDPNAPPKSPSLGFSTIVFGSSI